MLPLQSHSKTTPFPGGRGRKSSQRGTESERGAPYRWGRPLNLPQPAQLP